VVRRACPAHECEACLAEAIEGLDRMLLLPGPMGRRRAERHFVPFSLLSTETKRDLQHR